MSRSRRIIRAFVLLLAAALVIQPHSLWACAACYGQSDSPLAKGMNWGIFSLLVMIVCVLGGIAAFFVFLAKKSAALSAAASVDQLVESGQKA